MDLLQSPENIAAQMKERGMKADYVFFFAYIQPKPKEGEGIWSSVDELVRINSKFYRSCINLYKKEIKRGKQRKKNFFVVDNWLNCI